MGTQPVNKFRAGQVACALWNNDIVVQGTKKTVLKATVERRYKDSNDIWKSSGSYSRNEIPLVIYCLQKAYAAMIDDQQQRADNDVTEEVIE